MSAIDDLQQKIQNLYEEARFKYLNPPGSEESQHFNEGESCAYEHVLEIIEEFKETTKVQNVKK